MASLNLFANIDKYTSDDVNYSFGELDDDNDVVELPEEKITKPVIKGRRGRAKTKSNPLPECKPDCDDSGSDNEVKVAPGVGQKTAFKKLSKLKQSLATTAITVQPNKRRSSVNAAIADAIQKKRSRRARAADTVEIQFDQPPPIVLQRPNRVEANIVNDSFDDEEFSVNVKIKWEGTSKIEKIQFSMYKTFKELVGILSSRENVDAKSFLLMLGNAVIKPDDSPHSIGYTLGKFISVRVVDNPHAYITESSSSSASQLNTIEVKIQSPQWKKPMICNIKLTDQFKVLCGILSEKLKCHPNKIRLKFDGDLISVTSTPQELDFDGGEIIDLLMTE